MKFIGCIVACVFLLIVQSCSNEKTKTAFLPNQDEIISLKLSIDSCLKSKNFNAYIQNQLSLADIYKKSDSLAAWLYCYDRIIKISRDNNSPENAIIYYKEVNDKIWRVPYDSASRNNLAWIHRQIAFEFGPKLQQWKLCIPYYLEGIDLIEASDSWTPDKAIKFLKPCGSAYTRFGEPQNAIGYLKKCYEICASENDTLSMVKSLNDLGLAYYDIAKFPEALTSFQIALSLNSSSKYLEERRGTLSKITTWYIDKKQIDSATYYFDLLKLITVNQNAEQDDIADFYSQQASYYALTNNYDKAEIYFEKAIQDFLASPENRGREAAKVYIESGNMYLEINDYKKSLAAFHQALKIIIPAYTAGDVNESVNDIYLYPENIIMEACSGKADAFLARYMADGNEEDKTSAIQFYGTALKTRNILLDSYELLSSKIIFEAKTDYISSKLDSVKLISTTDNNPL